MEIGIALSAFIAKGVVDERVIQCLLSDDGFAPIEGELLDYKRELPSDAVALAKCAIQIVSLHNTFGGYLVFGVDEVSRDQRFRPCGIPRDSANVQQLRSLVRNYTGRTINIVFADLSVRFLGSPLTLGLLFVPKRLAHMTPVQFGKPSPKRDDKSVFSVGDVFFRLQDTNARAQSSQDWWFLASERPNPHSSHDTLAVPLVGSRKKIVDENLPDRNLICPKFVGREGVILELWHWLSDDFQYAKVLAGDGGKGKTSIAYEFAEEVCRSRPFDFEKVIWLTAKKKQFRGLKDDYDPVAAHYDSYHELLRALCDQLAVLPQEIEDSSSNLLKQILREAFSEIHTFVVIDDVDSLPPDEQRMVLELALQIGNSRSRFLLTTRKNFTYSADLSITVVGFGKEDYTEYVASLQERFRDIRLSRAAIEKLRHATDGSPLYTESLVRLLRNCMDIDAAIGQWKGALGMKVRRAALDREVKHLSLESRRVLLASVYLFECSYTELRQVTGYFDEDLMQYLDELRALFLISAPRIISKEARFSVQTNTRTLVLEYEKSLVTDPASIRNKCAKIRSGADSITKRGDRKEVAAAITQANAFLREDDWESAYATVSTILGRQKGNPDLLFVLAKCLLSKQPPDYKSAKRQLKEAYDSGNGQRKYQLYVTWYDCEMESRHPVGAVEVANLALHDDIADRGVWFIKRAAAYKASSLIREGNDSAGAIEELRACNADLKAARALSRQTNQTEEILASLETVGRQVWSLCERSAHDIPGWVAAFDVLKEIVMPASNAPMLASNMVRSVETIVALAGAKRSPTQAQVNLASQLLRQATGYVSTNRDANSRFAFADVESRISALSIRIAKLQVELGHQGPMTILKTRDGEVDVFLAHNSRDKAAVRWISGKLEDLGFTTWLDEKDIPPGQLFQDYIQKALPKAKAIAIIIGPSGLGRWQAFELRTAISSAVERGIPVIPVFLPDSKDVSAELPFLTEFNYVRFKAFDDPDALELLVWGVSHTTSTLL
jgi:KaiC/GvpD/RAD55 family RecA-like ATPase